METVGGNIVQDIEQLRQQLLASGVATIQKDKVTHFSKRTFCVTAYKDDKYVKMVYVDRMADAKRWRQEFRKECLVAHIEETETFLANGEKLTFPTPETRPEIFGKVCFETPEIPEKKQEAERLQRIQKRDFFQSRKQNAKQPVRYTSIGRAKTSTLHKEYMNAFKKFGFRVVDRKGNKIFEGLRVELVDFLKNRNPFPLNDIKIQYIGTEPR